MGMSWGMMENTHIRKYIYTYKCNLVAAGGSPSFALEEEFDLSRTLAFSIIFDYWWSS